MKYLAAYALIKLGGNAEPTANDVEAFLKENGVKADKERINDLIEKFSSKDFNGLVETGTEQMASMAPQSEMPAAIQEIDGKVDGPVAEIVEIDHTMGKLFDSDEDY